MKGLIEREIARDRLLETAPSLSPELRQKAVQIYLNHVGIRADSELQQWMFSEALDQHQLQCRAERFVAWTNLCEQRFKSQIFSLFLKRKAYLDRVVYCAHWVDDEALAHELFIRLKERECCFEELLCSIPAGASQGFPSGKMVLALQDLPEALFDLLRVSKPGQVWPPNLLRGAGSFSNWKNCSRLFLINRSSSPRLEMGDRWLQDSSVVQSTGDLMSANGVRFCEGLMQKSHSSPFFLVFV